MTWHTVVVAAYWAAVILAGVLALAVIDNHDHKRRAASWQPIDLDGARRRAQHPYDQQEHTNQ